MTYIKKFLYVFILAFIFGYFFGPYFYYTFNKPQELNGVSQMTISIKDSSEKLESSILLVSLVTSEECWYNKIYNSVYTKDPGKNWAPNHIINYFQSKLYNFFDYNRMINVYKDIDTLRLKSELPNISAHNISISVTCNKR